MKKNKIENKLAFKKASVAELNENTLLQVNGGTMATTTVGTTSTLVITLTVSSDVILNEN